MGKKFALFAFIGNPMCFAHVLLNALDMYAKDHAVTIIVKGSATKLVDTPNESDQPFANLYRKVKEFGLIDCVCKACARKMGSLDAAIKQNLRLGSDMSGHPGMSKYIDGGYIIITF